MTFLNLQQFKKKNLLNVHNSCIRAKVGVEIEFYLHNLSPNQVAKEIKTIALKNNIDINNIEQEDGLNQFEIQTHPTFHIEKLCNFFEEFIKYSKNNNIIISPKPFKDQPGNGLHIHLSFFDENNNNVFTAQEHMIGFASNGCLRDIKQDILHFAPEKENYDRFIIPSMSDKFKHNPTTISWGFDNRTCLIRIPPIINNRNEELRIEHRLSGVNVNLKTCIYKIIDSAKKGITEQLNIYPPTYNDSFSYQGNDKPIFLPYSIEFAKASY